MRAGPELDAEIVRALWRYLVVFEPETGAYSMISAMGSEAIPPYSTDERAVAQVKEHFADLGWKLKTRKDRDRFSASFWKRDGNAYRSFFADTLPEAICHAALAIHGGTNIQSRSSEDT